MEELRKAMEICKIGYVEGKDEKLTNYGKAILTLLSTCQLLCDVSDTMLGKKEISGKNMGAFQSQTNIGYNFARSEDILWLTKRMMGIESKVEETIRRVKLWYGGTGKERDEGIDDDGAIELILDAIRQEMGIDK